MITVSLHITEATGTAELQDFAIAVRELDDPSKITTLGTTDEGELYAQIIDKE